MSASHPSGSASSSRHRSSSRSVSPRRPAPMNRTKSLCVAPMHIPIPPSLLRSPYLNSPQSIFQRASSQSQSPSKEDEQWLQDTVPIYATTQARSMGCKRHSVSGALSHSSSDPSAIQMRRREQDRSQRIIIKRSDSHIPRTAYAPSSPPLVRLRMNAPVTVLAPIKSRSEPNIPGLL